MQVFPGRDGVVRTVEVKTVSGKFIRSVPRIHDLELMTGGSDDPVRAETISAPSTPLKTVDDNQIVMLLLVRALLNHMWRVEVVWLNQLWD